jgi:hypothetical protein
MTFSHILVQRPYFIGTIAKIVWLFSLFNNICQFIILLCPPRDMRKYTNRTSELCGLTMMSTQVFDVNLKPGTSTSHLDRN